MRKCIFIFSLFIAGFFSTVSAQVFSNKGKDFWVAFRSTSGISAGNPQQFRIYMGADAVGDTVQISIAEGTPREWIRKYYVAPFTTVTSDSIPTDSAYAGSAAAFHAKGGIHIKSKNADISAYAHIYEGANSGGSMLMPVNVMGCEYYALSSRQYYSSASYSRIHLVATHDSTWVEINPSKPTRNGWTHNGGTEPNGSYLVKLNKGDTYLLLGGILSGSEGYDLTGSSVISIPNPQGVCHPIAVFCGSTRTNINCGAVTGGGGDLIFQQSFPYQYWGSAYATAPTSNQVGPTATSNMTNIFRIMVKDTITNVVLNGVTLPVSSLVNGKYYQYESNTPDYITADKPVLVAQFMTSSDNNCPGNSGDGDPEMFYISAIHQAVKTAQFYRSNKDAIDENFITLVLPTAGLTTLQIDGANYSTYGALVRASAHPNLPGFSVVTKKWNAGAGFSRVSCGAPFTGIVYGMGTVESYGYNIGAGFDTLSYQALRFNIIHGYMFLDQNSNTVKDPNEPFFKAAALSTVKPGLDSFYSITGTGIFDIYTDTGSYKTEAVPDLPYYNVVPASHHTNFTTFFNTDSVAFALQPFPDMHDLSISVTQSTTCRLGRPVIYYLKYENKGTDTTDALIEVIKSDKLNFVSASTPPTFVSGDTLRWTITALQPGRNGEIMVNFVVKVPPVANLGDTIISTVSISSVLVDLAYDDNKAVSITRITGSYDPNDKTESHAGSISLANAMNGEYLYYTIRFQNTGNDTAFRASVTDTLDDKLDWSTFEITAASHDYQASINGDRYITCNFNSIYLPDSLHNEPASHGYLTYRIKPKNTVQVGDVIHNNASIWFDQNLPVVTNTESTLITAGIAPLQLLSFTATKAGKANRLEWHTANEINVDRFEVERSATGQRFQTIGIVKSSEAPSDNNYRFIDNTGFTYGVSKLYYRIKMIDKDGRFTYSPARLLVQSERFVVSLRPNPVKDRIWVDMVNDKRQQVSMKILSQEGRLLLQQQWQIEDGNVSKLINTSLLQKGIYLLTVTNQDGEQQVLRFEKL